MDTDGAVVQLMERITDRFYGKYRGLVTDTSDPLGRGRVKARVPEVLQDVETGWALPCAPYSGDDAGMFTVPPVGAGVWIEFEAGDPARPIWTGCWWGDGDVPDSAMPEQKVWKSEQGLRVKLDDSAQEILIDDKNDTNLVKIEALSGTITIQASTKVTVEAPLIDLGQNASHPAVFGDQLLTYLNQLGTLYQTHIHPGELAAGILPVTPAPPVPPFPPATPALLSTKVMEE
jgi:uncharacterized protein involved in type VI secretion and phage assembly